MAFMQVPTLTSVSEGFKEVTEVAVREQKQKLQVDIHFQSPHYS